MGKTPAADVGVTGHASAGPPRPVALMLPGQGSQHPGMASGLYEREPVFTQAMDAVFGMLGEHGRQIRNDWLSASPAVPIDEVARAQPLLFAVEYALGRMIMNWGVRPAALIGHSVGEFSAAALAGVFSLADAVRLLWDRVEQIAMLPAGGMLAVRAAPADVVSYLPPQVVVGAINAPRQILLAGPCAPLDLARQRLSAAGFYCRMAQATRAFHSPAAAPAAGASLAGFAGIRLGDPRIPVYSAYTGTVMTPEVARDASFWAAQPAAPVYFWAALDEMLTREPFLLVETGPAQGLSAIARQHRSVASGQSDVAALLPARWAGPAGDRRASLEASVRILAEGHELDAPAW
jgi:[acyl-carrier-protein] S-malonyltransferase